MNPARSTGPALFEGGWALDHFWLFWAAPLVGGVLAGIVYPALTRVRPGAELPAESEQRSSSVERAAAGEVEVAGRSKSTVAC